MSGPRFASRQARGVDPPPVHLYVRALSGSCRRSNPVAGNDYATAAVRGGGAACIIFGESRVVNPKGSPLRA